VPTYFVSPALSGLFGQFGHQIGFQLALGGLGLIAVLMLYPSGVAGAASRVWEAYLERLARSLARRTRPGRSALLVAEDVRLHFGGVTALDDVTVEVRDGEIVGLIGPNGAGKTTLLNVVSGVLQPEHGSLRLRGEELVGLAPELRSAFGLGRSFQDASLFPGLTVAETVQVGLTSTHRVGFLAAALGAPWARAAETATAEGARQLLERLGLTPWADALTSQLSTGTRRICDLAAQLAAGPSVLLLDEPTAGVAQREVEAFGPLLRNVRDELGCSVLIVEHDLPLLMSVCDRIYAMEAGRVIAEGSPAEIQENPQVLASYLGVAKPEPSRGSRPRRRNVKQPAAASGGARRLP
jgi:ABC-type branched-subunit amino acid transport system ATPase component